MEFSMYEERWKLVVSARKRLCCALLSSLCTTTQSKGPLEQLGKARAAALAGGEGALRCVNMDAVGEEVYVLKLLLFICKPPAAASPHSGGAMTSGIGMGPPPLTPRTQVRQEVGLTACNTRKPSSHALHSSKLLE